MANRCLSALVAAWPLVAAAQPTTAPLPPALQPISLQVIDAGPAIPLSPYVSYMIAGADQAGVLAGLTFPLVTRLPSARLMKAGTQVLQRKWVTHPIFLIGSDRQSVQWLHDNGKALRAMDAAGVVLAAPNAQAFKQVQALADHLDLPIAPGPDPWLEAQLLAHGVGVLPLLIGMDGRARQEVPDS